MAVTRRFLSENADTDDDGIEALDRAECVRLLTGHTFGRAGLTVGALPTVLPVPYCLIDDRIFFRTAHNPKLAAATNGTVIAFEIDYLDATRRAGWHVVAIGLSQHLARPAQIQKLDDHGLAKWTPKGPALVVEMSIDLVSGRRMLPGFDGGPGNRA